MPKRGQYFAWLVGLMVVVSCGRVATPPPSPVENTGVAAAPASTPSPMINTPVATTSTPTLPTPTITPTHEPTLTPSPEPSSTTTPTPVPTATDVPILPEGILFGIDNSEYDGIMGIWRLDFLTSEKSYVMTKEDDWLYWEARFSPNNKWIVYWVQKETTAEIWVSSLPSWNPELLLTLPEIRDDFVLLSWLAVDKYILIEFIKEVEPFSAYTNRTKVYLLDRSDHQIKYASTGLDTNDSLGYYTNAETCGLLAKSPKTNLFSVWCKMSEEQAGLYTVIESNSEIWISEEQPQSIIEETRFGTDLLIWSADGAYVAYAAGEVRDYLYYSPSNSYEPTRLLDQRTDLYSEIVFSPDNNYIAYTGKCIHYRCAIIMDVSLGQIIWTGYELPDSQPLSLFWSPDSRFLGVYLLPQGIFIIDVHNQEIVMELPETGYSVVWVDN